MEKWLKYQDWSPDFTIPILVRRSELFDVYYPSEKWLKSKVLVDCKKKFSPASYKNAIFIDSLGQKRIIKKARLGKYTFPDWFGALDYLFPHPGHWPRQVEVIFEDCGQVDFQTFKKELIQFITDKKWYRVPNQGLSIKEQYNVVEKAATTENFADLFDAISWMMSPAYRRKHMDEE